MGNRETTIQNRIMAGVSDIAVLIRVPAGQYWAGKMVDGVLVNPRPVRVAITGFPDLAGYRRSDGRAVYIEVKQGKGKATKEQEKFIEVARQAGCLAGVARSVEEARAIVEGEEER